MTHFTVLVRLRKGDDLGAMMLPYKEAGCGDKDPPELQKYCVFYDEGPAFKEGYENGSSEFVHWKGSLLRKWDDAFRVPGTFGSGSGTHKVPEGASVVSIPHKVTYKTFEEFCKEWHGMERNAEGKIGYWKNPNEKWDYWSEMERKTVRSLDFKVQDEGARQEATKFYKEWETACRTEDINAIQDGFDGPRRMALRLGLISCEDKVKLTGDAWKVIPWPKNDVRVDILHELPPLEVFLDKFQAVFHPLRSWAYLDHTGWHEPGKMGWWAISSETPDQYLEYARTFQTWIRSGDVDDLLVKVDCHI